MRRKKKADGEVGPDETCCHGVSALAVVALKIVNVGRVYRKAKMPEVLGINHI